MTDSVDFTSRVAAITGAGRGLGREYALELARRGAAVVVNDSGGGTDGAGLDPAPAQSTVDEIIRLGGRAVACVIDASTEAGGKAVIDTALEHFGQVDAVVANAGTIVNAPFEEWSPAQFRDAFQHHLFGAFHVVQPAYVSMKAAGYGRIVFVSSAAGVFGQPGVTGYAAAKTAMLGLMNVVSLEGAEHGIRANAIMPMGHTRLAAAVLGAAADTPDAQAFLSGFRLDQVAPVVAYLASQNCALSKTVLSAFMGRVAALQLGVTSGWVSPEKSFAAEDVQRELSAITDTSGVFVPDSIVDEIGYTVSVV